MIVNVAGHCINCGDNSCEGCKDQPTIEHKPITSGGDVTDGKIKDWRPGLWSANTTMQDRPMVVARTQSTMRDDAFFSGAARSQRSVVVGPNVRVKFRMDWRKINDLGCSVDREWAQEQSLNLRRQWTCDMEDPTRCWSDAAGKQTFSHQLGTAYLEWTGAGEVLMVSVPEDGPSARPMTTSWALVDSARLSTRTKDFGKENIVDGIKETKNGQPMAYYIADYHPELNDPTCRYSNRLRSTIKRRKGQKGIEDEWSIFYPRYKWGRPQTIHFYDKDRANLSRAKPQFSAALKHHFMADEYSNAAVDAAIRDAQMAMWIESSDPHLIQAFASMGLSPEECIPKAMGAMAQARSDLYGDRSISMNGAALAQLNENESIKTNPLGSPSDNHTEFLKTQLAYGARALDLSQQTFLGDASDANYSSLRHASVMDWYSRMYQRDLLFNYVGTPMAIAWLEDKVAMGQFEMPCGGSRAKQLNFFLKHRGLFTVQFYGPGQVGIDDLKQYKMLRTKIKDRVMTLEEYYFQYTNEYMEDAHDQMLFEDIMRDELACPKVCDEGKDSITLNNNDKDI